jgi:hypothetical protein
VFVEPCFATDVGAFLASGVDGESVPEPHDSVRPWWDVLALARVRAVVSRWLVVEAQGEFTVPLVRERYGFGDPQVEAVYEVPPVGVSARAGIGFRIP